MVVNSSQTLSQVASFLKVQAGKIITNEDLLPTRVASKNTTSGFINIIFQLLKESNNSSLGGENISQQAEVRQWIEYAIVYASQSDLLANTNQVLKELNAILASRTYLVAHRLTVADVFLYYILYNTMEGLPILDKEKFVNVSRWFDNLQQNPLIRQSNKNIDFSTIYLATIAPARH